MTRRPGGVFDTGTPGISNLFRGAVTGRLLIGVNMPVFLNGRVAYGLFMTVPADRLAAILSQQHLPAEWVGVIFDNNQMIVARAPHPEAFVGKHVAPDVSRRLSDTGENTGEITNLQGIRMVDSFSRSGFPAGP